MTVQTDPTIHPLTAGPSSSAEPSPLTKLVYSINEVAELLGVSRSLTYDLIRNGKLPSFKIGHRRLIAAEDVSALIQSLREEAEVVA